MLWECGLVQLLNHVWLFVTQWTAACQASLSFTISQSWLKLMSTESVMLSNHLILGRPCLLLPSIFLSITVFPNELANTCGLLTEKLTIHNKFVSEKSNSPSFQCFGVNKLSRVTLLGKSFKRNYWTLKIKVITTDHATQYCLHQCPGVKIRRRFSYCWPSVLEEALVTIKVISSFSELFKRLFS